MKNYDKEKKVHRNMEDAIPWSDETKKNKVDSKRDKLKMKEIFKITLIELVVLSILVAAFIIVLKNNRELSRPNNLNSSPVIATTSDVYLKLNNANIILEIADSGLLEIKKQPCECDCDKYCENLNTIDQKKDEVFINNIVEVEVEVEKEESNGEKEDLFDFDNDGLSNNEEFRYGTDPRKADSDGDGYSDKEEIDNGYNPLGEGRISIQAAKEEKVKLVKKDKIEDTGLVSATKASSTFSVFKDKAGVIATSFTSFFKAKFGKQEVITADTIKSFLGLSDKQFESFINIAKKEQVELMAGIKTTEATFRENITKLLGGKFSLTTNDFIWPVPKNTVTSKFHDESYPFKNVFEHSGIDIRVKQGTVVRAVNSGYVAKVVDGGETGYSYVLLVHGDDFSSVYGHLSRIEVEEGERLSQGEVLGFSGGTPGTAGAGKLTTGPHLHLEIRKNGDPLDPLLYLK